MTQLYNTYKWYIHCTWYIVLCTFLSSCRQEFPTLGEEGEIAVGESVIFTTLVPDAETTRSARTDWETEVKTYKAVNLPYDFTISMYHEGSVDPAATAVYSPVQTTSVGGAAIDGYDGTLRLKDESATPLIWQDNSTRWGFRAVANDNELVADQSTEAKWLAMDHLTGHSYLPLWTGDDETGAGTNPDLIQYKTSREWYRDNKTAKDLEGLMVSSNEDYKKIPLYLRHQRAWITIILRAGEGVEREALSYNHAATDISALINSFSTGSSVPFPITQAWAREQLIDYEKDKTGPAATNVSTTRYDAIVMPHNYATRKDEEAIARITVSSQNFSFYASNDTRLLDNATAEQRAQAEKDYDLSAGKHLTIEATLSRGSRKILITAWVEDWTEAATATICDDYGQNGDPIVIKNRRELIAFLTNPKTNKQGSVGIIQPASLNLDTVGDPWSAHQTELHATLNLAGSTLYTSSRLFTTIATSGNVVNGTVDIQDGATVDCAIALTNEGTLERVHVTTSGELSTAHAEIAGMVGTNHGTIYQCTSTLPVWGDTGHSDGTVSGYIGGIAAISVSSGTGTMAVIDACTVNAAVRQSSDPLTASTLQGGGIVGYTTGRVSNNTYEYGITVRQNTTRFKNIFAFAGSEELRAYNNAWPSDVLNPISNETAEAQNNINIWSGTRAHSVIDCQADLDYVLNAVDLYNAKDKICRISKSFTVLSSSVAEDDWTHGTGSADDPNFKRESNVYCCLEGNNKTITLDGNKQVSTTTGMNSSSGTPQSYTTAPMLFYYIIGQVQNLTLMLNQPVVAQPTEKLDAHGVLEYDAADAIAPLAYAAFGEQAAITNVKVKTAGDSQFVQASTPAGLIVWAISGATISDCGVRVPVRMWLPSNMGTDAKHYAGGIVACAGVATVARCTYYVNSEDAVTGSAYSTTALNSANYYYGGIVGGTSRKFSDLPSLQIVDCTSWYLSQTSVTTNLSSRASIIANSTYAAVDASGKKTNGMSTTHPSEGNWWNIGSTGCKEFASGLTEEQVIGRRNAASMEYPEDF